MTTEQNIVEAAEARIRSDGYNGFSFRDIARDTGLTNAGVHHYFPTKADLSAHVAQRYATHFLDALDVVPAQARVGRLQSLFADSFHKDGKMCLCGMLAAESGGLPEKVTEATRVFFQELTKRLTPAFSEAADPEGEAMAVIARLEGAILLANILPGSDAFERATRGVA